MMMQCITLYYLLIINTNVTMLAHAWQSAATLFFLSHTHKHKHTHTHNLHYIIIHIHKSAGHTCNKIKQKQEDRQHTHIHTLTHTHTHTHTPWIQQTRELIHTQKTRHKHNKDPTQILLGMQVNTMNINFARVTDKTGIQWDKNSERKNILVWPFCHQWDEQAKLSRGYHHTKVNRSCLKK